MQPRLLSGLTSSRLLRGGGGAGASGLLLDNITNAASITGVWSLRKLKSAYAGSCVRIRRSSDNAEQDFGFSADVVDTAGIASFVGGGSGYAVTWYDQSGGGRNATQSTAGAQPLFVASGIGGKPSLQFDGSNDVLTVASVASLDAVSSNEMYLNIVLNQNSSQVQNGTFALRSSYPTLVSIAATYSDVIYFDMGDTPAVSGSSASQPVGWDDADNVFEAWRTTGNVQVIAVNGSTLNSVTKSDTVSSVTTTIDIGAQSGRVLFQKGNIAECVLSKVDMGSTDRATIRADQGSYFGITVV